VERKTKAGASTKKDRLADLALISSNVVSLRWQHGSSSGHIDYADKTKTIQSQRYVDKWQIIWLNSHK